MRAMEKVRDLLAGLLRGKAPSELTSEEARALIVALESDQNRLRLEHANARRTAQKFRARAAFEKPTADRVVDDAIARAKKLADEMEAIDDAIAGARDQLAAATAREKRAADEVWGAGLREWVTKRQARLARADALVKELGKLAIEEAEAGREQWLAMPNAMRDTTPSGMFNGSALALAVMRRMTAASHGVIVGERLVQPREYAEVAVEPFDTQAGQYQHLEAGIQSVLGDGKTHENEPETAEAA